MKRSICSPVCAIVALNVCAMLLGGCTSDPTANAGVSNALSGLVGTALELGLLHFLV